MIRYLYHEELARFPTLRDSMFRDRAHQFHDRRGWDLAVDEHGAERDQYDTSAALYVIWERRDDTHGGSMRVLPTTVPTMVNDHFSHLSFGEQIVNERIWECTRFCLSPDAEPRVAAALMLAGHEIGLNFGLSHAVGVFDTCMERIYRRLGWGPIVLGAAGRGRAKVSLGLWEFSETVYDQLAGKAQIVPQLSRLWFDRAFDDSFGRAGAWAASA